MKRADVKSMRIKFEPSGNSVVLTSTCTVLEAAKKAGLRIRSECGGKGTCGKCRIVVVDPKGLSKAIEVEIQNLSKREMQIGYRLACCSLVEGDVTVLIPRESQMSEMRILAEGVEDRVKFDPSTKKFHTRLPKPLMIDARTDVERMFDVLGEAYNINKLEISHGLLRQLPNILRKADWNITATVRNDHEIIDVESGISANSIYGFAVDIGTSTIVACLVNLATGEVVGVKSVENPQMIFGEDVVSRILYASRSKRNLTVLQRLIARFVNFLLQEASKEAKVKMRNIYEMTVVGNTAMHHLFLGIQPKYLSLAPYVPAVKRSLTLKAKELGIRINPQSYIHVLPVVAGYVGADAVADVLATGIHKTEKMSLLVDIGTNGEIFVGNKHGILSCSCAAGPAFEGAHIKHGMRAYLGAIEKIRIAPETYDVEYETIGEVKPIGICGSGIVDAVAEMFKCRIINSRGRFNNILSSRLRVQNNETEFVIAWKEETDIEIDLVVTQKDVDETQLAKAALHTGCAILMKRKMVTPKDIDQLLIAGAFGRYVNPENIRLIGLVPDITAKKIKFVGNTALSGAKMVLLSREAKKEAESLSRWIDYLELAADPDFKMEYIYSTYLPHKDPKRSLSVMKRFEE